MNKCIDCYYYTDEDKEEREGLQAELDAYVEPKLKWWQSRPMLGDDFFLAIQIKVRQPACSSLLDDRKTTPDNYCKDWKKR